MSKIIILVFTFFLIIMKYLQTYISRPTSQSKLEYSEKWTFTVLVILHHVFLFCSVTEFILKEFSLNIYISLVGIILFVFSLIFREWTIRTLDKLWTVHIEIKKEHELIKEGPFKLMRHPAYFSLFVEIIGFPLILNAYITLLLIVIIYFPFLIYRIFVEEGQLQKKFHKDYSYYRRNNWALFPFIKPKGTHKVSRLIPFTFRKILRRW